MAAQSCTAFMKTVKLESAIDLAEMRQLCYSTFCVCIAEEYTWCLSVL